MLLIFKQISFYYIELTLIIIISFLFPLSKGCSSVIDRQPSFIIDNKKSGTNFADFTVVQNCVSVKFVPDL